jgi:hypothetical protein
MLVLMVSRSVQTQIGNTDMIDFLFANKLQMNTMQMIRSYLIRLVILMQSSCSGKEDLVSTAASELAMVELQF